MKESTFIKTASVVFGIVSIVHLLRVILGWSFEVGGVTIPLWVSWVAFVLIGFLSIQGFRY